MAKPDIFVTRYFMGLAGNLGDEILQLICPVIGAVLIWLSSLSVWGRIVLTVCYLPAMYYCLSIFGLLFVGSVFDHWL